MARTTLSNSAGPGSSTPLAPQTIKVRDAVIAKCDGQSLDEMNEFVKGLLDREEDELKRLGILAARVYILRQRIIALMESGALSTKDKKLDFIDPSPEVPDDDIDVFSDLDDDNNKDTDWMRVRIIETCEVNGVRFPSGVVIDVHADDANKLIEFGKAELQAKDLGDDFSDIPDDLADTDDATADTGDEMADTGDVMADTGDAMADTGDVMADTGDAIADTDNDLADMVDEGGMEEEPETSESDIITDTDSDDTDIADTESSQDDVMSDDTPDEIDLTTPLPEDDSETDISEDTSSEDTADNEAIAAAVAEKMPKASASSPDGEPVETSETELDAGLQELDDLEELDAETDDSQKKTDKDE